MKSLKINDITIGGELDGHNEIAILISKGKIDFINEDKAKQIINHLSKAFNLDHAAEKVSERVNNLILKKQPIEIKPGVWCNDIPSRSEFDKFYNSLVALNIRMCGNVSHSDYLEYGNVGIEVDGMAYHASDSSYFTTQVSYRDIIAAANAMES